MAKKEGHAEITLFDDHVLASLSNHKLENRGAIVFVNPISLFVSRRPESHPFLSRGERKKSCLPSFWILLFIPIERELSVPDIRPADW